MSRRIYLLFLVFAILALVMRFLGFWSQPKLVLPKNRQITFVGTVKETPKLNESSQIVALGDVKVYLKKYPSFKVGDRLKVTGRADDLGRIFDPAVEKVGQRLSFNGYFLTLREDISKKILRLLPLREATLVVGSVLGVDTIEADFKEVLIKTGTIHVVVVSGQNLAIVAGIFVGMASYLGRRRAMALAVLATFLYAALTGFEPPVLRAALMVLATTFAVYFGRQLAPLGGLLISAYVILFAWPAALLDLSFQLTFAASFGIVTLGAKLQRIFVGKDKGTGDDGGVLRRLLALLGTNAAVSGSAYLYTSPLILFYFGKVSLFSPLVNVLVAEAVFPIMILGFGVTVFAVLLMPMAQFLAYFVYVPAVYFVKVVEFAAKIPVGQISIGQNSIIFVLGFYTALLFLTFGRLRASRK